MPGVGGQREAVPGVGGGQCWQLGPWLVPSRLRRAPQARQVGEGRARAR